MKEIINLRLPAHLGAFPSIKNVTAVAIDIRSIFLSNMSGYPMGSHAVGRLQAMLYTATSYKELLTVIKRMRDITKYAADIIYTMETTRVEKYTLNRTEIIAYIELNSGTSAISLTPDETEFVAYLIVAPETGDSGWTLAFDTDNAENKIIQFQTMYQSISKAGSASLNDAGTLIDKANDVNVVYDPETDEIASLATTRRFRKATNDSAKRASKIKKAEERAIIISDINTDIANGYAVYHMSSIRVIDHVLMLLTNIDIWPAFVSPRLKTEASVNGERARSLRAFSAYLHSLLMYPHLFSIELFMGSYHKLTEWIKTFMPLSKETVDRYDGMIRKHDVLSAREDATAVLNLIDESKSNPTGSTILGLPLEVQSLFEIEDVIKHLDDVASKVPAAVDITSLKSALKDEAYKPYIYSHPIAEYQIVQNLTNSIILGHAVTDQVNQAAVGAMNGVPRYYTDEILTRLKAINPVIPFGFSPRIPMVDRFASNTEASLVNGAMHFTPLTPMRSYNLQEFIRKEKMAEIFKASAITDPKESGYMPRVLFNRDKAKHLTGILMRDMRSLYPSSLCYNDTVFTPAMFTTNDEFTNNQSVKRLLEALTGMSFTMIKNEIGSEFLKKTWATFLSSFALLYVVPSENALELASSKGQDKDIISLLTPHLVEGYGKPYGVTYSALMGKQDGTKSASFVRITDHVYLRFLTSIPLPTHDLTVDSDFYLSHPNYYFAGNSASISVDKWVIDEGLLHHALAPSPKPVSKPELLLDRTYAYVNDRLLMQTDMNYSIGTADDETMRIPLTTRNWSFDRFFYHIEYITFGSYGTTGKTAAAVEMTETNEMITNIEKAMKESMDDSTVARLDEAKTDILKESHPKIASDVHVEESHHAGHNDDGKKKKKKQDNDDDEDEADRKEQGAADSKE